MNIKSAIGNSSSSSNKISKQQSENSTYRLNALAECVHTTLNPIQTFNLFRWKNISFVLLAVSAPSLANDNVIVDKSSKGQVFVEERASKNGQGNILVIDIAKPDSDGISDNRFEKLNIPNSAVFNNSLHKDKSTIVGELDKNRYFKEDATKAILNQVTGKDMSTIQGGLEVFGEKADLIIVNPNGVTLNGVKTFNSDRFVVSTSDVIAKGKRNLSVNKGTVIIGKDGVATNGLSYFDVVAKTIKQEGSIGLDEKDTVHKTPANITLVAGSANYNLKTYKATGKNQKAKKDEIAISGEVAGAMYGKNIQLITTDTGAGVNHQGAILSEKDIKIVTQTGDITVNEIHSNKVAVIGKNLDITKKGTVRANETVALNLTENVTLHESSNIVAKKTSIKTKKALIKKDATLIATNLAVEAKEKIVNDGSLLARSNKLKTKELTNNQGGEILAENLLEITVQGKKGVESNGYINHGTIKSNKDTILTFANNSNYVSQGFALPETQEHLTINAYDAEISEKDEIQQQAKVTVNAKGKFSNHGLLTSAKELSINSKKDITNNGLLGAKAILRLVSQQGEVLNSINSTLHSEGTTYLDAKNRVLNLGEIYSKGKIYVNTLKLENKADIEGKVGSAIFELSDTHYASYDLRYDEIFVEGFFNELIISSDLKVKNMGRIISEGGLEFTSKDKSKSSIINNGILNVKGDLKYDANVFTNNMESIQVDLYKALFANKNKVTVRFQPKLRFLATPLDQTAIYEFEDLGTLVDYVFNDSEYIRTPLYYADKLEVLNALKNIPAPTLQKGLSAVFGAGWDSNGSITFTNSGDPEHFKKLKTRWEQFKQNAVKVHFYPDQKAKVFADKIIGSNESSSSSFQNGAYSEVGDTAKPTDEFRVGKHSILVPEAYFESYTDTIQQNSNGIDLSALAELLSQPYLFIDKSAYREKTESKDRVLSKKEDRKLLEETEEEKQQREAERKKQAQERLRQEKEKIRKEQEKRVRQQKEKAEAEQKLKQLAKEKKRIEQEKRKQAEQARQAREKEKQRIENERKDREKKLKEEQKRLEALQAQRQQAEEKRKKQLEQKEKALTEKILRLQREQEEKDVQARVEREKQEKQRKQAEEKKRQELKRLENEEKQQKEKLKKLEAERKEEEQRKADEEKQRLAYEKALEDARRKTEALNRKQTIPEKNDLPKVETEALYRTRLHYINQDDYIGGKYFFNKIAPRNQELKKVETVGDNYFEHQLITRTIEKKVDNHLSLKYDLNNIQLVKKLMDNAYFEAKDLKLTLGQALTEEQQKKLKEDIIWYVKTNVNGKEVFVPQVYFAQQTLDDAEKFRGVGNAVIRAREINAKAKNIRNSATIAGDDVNLKAEHKIKNRGDILSKNEARLYGKKGIESSGTAYIDEKGNTKVRKSKINSDGHLHLETDTDSSVDLTASEVKAKTGQVKAKDLNLKDTYETNRSREYQEYRYELGAIHLPGGHTTTDVSQVKSVGTEAEFDHLHLSLHGDVNQTGSKLLTNRTTGVVKGDFNTKAGKDILAREVNSFSLGGEVSATASGGGSTVGVTVSEEGKQVHQGKSNTAGVSAGSMLTLNWKTDKETTLTHKNSELTAKSGELYVLNKADIGGIDINKDVSVLDTERKSDKSSDLAQEGNAHIAEATEKTTASQPENKETLTFNILNDEQIAKELETKDRSFFDKHKANEIEDQKKGFTLSAKRVASTKEKDEKETYSSKVKVGFGIETEGHSAIADAVSNSVRQIRDSQKGIKQDGTANITTIK
ncbi:filamentous hemagglutinin N-terminal domain-containing protein [Actinobacillus arthritidis]|uniref:two-partner secretion domain-containing protein n=1 Tax=Actinobacillus arthritidis TaxID=157339 RepID=UPI002442652E|nr:filamentous hemagglutinin N-terminal domain-containing protein [Actinobacillus arthritidis]WGE89975.1 filamentous hemagglutinin N-terminal domain-containing protein [Actinobacillus arthritidis]